MRSSPTSCRDSSAPWNGPRPGSTTRARSPTPRSLPGSRPGSRELPPEAARPRDVSVPSSWRLGSAACVLLGFGLLLVAALLVAGGAPGGH